MSEASGKEPDSMPPFSLGEPEELRSLAVDAGFKNVQVHQAVKISRFASANQFVEAIAAGAATTRRALEAFDESTREKIGTVVSASLQKYMDQDGLGLPMEANILMASN